MTAAICATSRASPRRSRRAISESLSVAGTAPSCPAASITLLVNSSAYSGTPSVLATIAATVSAERPCEAATPATSSAHSARPRRPSVSSVECGRADQGGAKSGRAVTRTSKCACPIQSDMRVNISSVVASIQCASSTIRSMGLASPRRTISSTSSAIVAAFRCAGVSDVGAGSGCGIESSSASNGIAERIRCRPIREQRTELCNSRVGRIGCCEARRARDVLDDRIERAVAMMRRTLQIDAAMRLACDVFLQRLDGARFADFGLAD